MRSLEFIQPFLKLNILFGQLRLSTLRFSQFSLKRIQTRGKRRVFRERLRSTAASLPFSFRRLRKLIAH
jgi:hypothetical protein